MTSSPQGVKSVISNIAEFNKSKYLRHLDAKEDCKIIAEKLCIDEDYFSINCCTAESDFYPYYDNRSKTNNGPVIYFIEWKHNYGSAAKKTPKASNVRVLSAEQFTVQENRNNYHYFSSSYNYYQNKIAVTLEVNGQTVFLISLLYVAEAAFGLHINENFDIVQGENIVGKFNFNDAIKGLEFRDSHWQVTQFVFNYTCVSTILSHIHPHDDRSRESIAKHVFSNPVWNTSFPKIKDGISKVYNQVLPFAKDCVQSNPHAALAFFTISEVAHKTQDGVKMSTIFNGIYGKVKNKEDFLSVSKLFDLSSTNENSNYLKYSRDPFGMVSVLPIYKEQRKKVLKSNGNRAFNKLMQEFDSLKIDEKQFPKTTKLIQSGKIPLTTFFRKSEQYFLLNDNWALWEEMLKRGHEEIVVELASEVCRRTTYEKDIMSYFYFVLYGLPEYLKKHTGKKWTCIPKLVDSATELEPPAEDGSGIRRSRSALTPIVDNEANTVTVPYASLRIPGQQTTYCYSLNYGILSKGFSWVGNACHVDIEEKLNGRDDYGLMFYTLTGSAQGRGYPSFLIIFERRKSGTHVHFHRTHPSRSKDGDYNPVHNWIRVCYNWMVGNVNKDLIRYQQGDLVFTVMTEEEAKDLVFAEKVERYDNHGFSKPVEFAQYTKKEKSNILGYARITEPTVLEHHEHEHIPMEPGTYTIRQCRSWEANPKGVWSLRID